MGTLTHSGGGEGLVLGNMKRGGGDSNSFWGRVGGYCRWSCRGGGGQSERRRGVKELYYQGGVIGGGHSTKGMVFICNAIVLEAIVL